MRSPKPKRLAAFAIVGITILAGAALFFDWAPILRGGFGWQWAYFPLGWDSATRLLPGVFSLAIYGLGLYGLHRRGRWLFLGWVFLGSIFIPIALLSFVDKPFHLLYSTTTSLVITGGYYTGAELDGLNELRQWPSILANGDIGRSRHISISPPGWTLSYYLTAKLLGFLPGFSEATARFLRSLQCDNPFINGHSDSQIASSWLGILSPIWGALTILPLYYLGRQVGNERLARTSVAWWPIVPALSAFMGTLNTPYPLLATTSVATLVSGLNQRTVGRSAVLFFLAGILTAISLIFNFALIPVLLLCGLLTLFFCQRQDGKWYNIEWRRAVLVGLQFGLGLALVLIVYRLLAGHHLHELLPIISKLHFELDRPYLVWMWLHTWDFILFAGLPAAGLSLLAALILPASPIRKLAAGLGLTLLIFVISGTARGETGRVWNFFIPILLLVTAAVFLEFSVRWRSSFVAAQVIWLLLIIAILRPVSSELAQPPIYASIAPKPLETPFIPVEANFGDEFQLTGFQGLYIPESNSVSLQLTWQRLKQIKTSYLFSILALDPAGNVVAKEQWLPLDNQFPTICWNFEGTEETQIMDRIVLNLNENAASGEWWFSLSAFDLSEEDTPIFLPVTLPNGDRDDHQVGLGPVDVQRQ